MSTILILILALAIAIGQLIKIPIGTQGGITVLDITVAFFCLIGLLKIKFHLKKPSPQILAALIFLFVATASLILSPLRLTTGDYIISFSYTGRFFLYLLFAWVIFSNAFGNPKDNLGKAFLYSGISLAILGLLQFIFFPNLFALSYLGYDPHYFRTVSTFFDPNFAGAFFVLTAILLFQNFNKDKKWNALFLIIIYLALLTTFSRSSYLMFLISGLGISYFKKSRILLLIILILSAGLTLGFRNYNQAVAKPRNINRQQSATLRLNTWQQGLILFQKSPMLGIGYNTYRFGLKEYNLGDKQFLNSHGSTSNDSSLLTVASTTGIIGLISFLCFLFFLFKGSNKQTRVIIIPAILGLLFHSFFANSLFYPPILAWILFIGAVPKK